MTAQNRFECELPKEVKRNFTAPKPRKPLDAKSALVVLLALTAGTLALVKAPVQKAPPPPPAPVVLPAVAPAPPLVRRAELVAPKAQPVIGAHYWLSLPDGRTVQTTFRGYLPGTAALPLHGAALGDMYAAGNVFWILAPIGDRLGWIDP
jgi:hypothetical protein